MRELEMIKKRMSVRNFDREAKLGEENLSKIISLIDGVKSLFPSIKYRIRYMEASETVSSSFAPHYLVFYSEEAPFYLENCGFILQQLELQLDLLGYGCCYYGFGRVDLLKTDFCELKFVIMLGFGFPDKSKKSERKLCDFNRKNVESICKGEGYEFFIEAVRLAPSAMNSQPWRILSSEKAVRIYREKLNILKKVALEKFNRIDIGICLYHLYLTCVSCGKGFDVTVETEVPYYGGNEYVLTVKY